jgi:hypothetical protein
MAAVLFLERLGGLQGGEIYLRYVGDEGQRGGQHQRSAGQI